LAPIQGSYNGTLNMTREFMGETIPCMFELQKEESPIFFTLFSSCSGKVAIVLVLLMPILVIFYPSIHNCLLKKSKLRNRKVPP